MILDAQQSNKTAPPPLLYQTPHGVSETVASVEINMDGVDFDGVELAQTDHEPSDARKGKAKARKSTLIASSKLAASVADFQLDDHTEAGMEPAMLLTKQNSDHASSEIDKLPSTWVQPPERHSGEHSGTEIEQSVDSDQGACSQLAGRIRP